MREIFINRNFKEMQDLEFLIQEFGDLAKVEVVDTIHYRGTEFPLYCLVLGNSAPENPAIGYFGGVHGLERIGSDVVLSYLQTILELVRWDKAFQRRLEKSSLVFMPIVNPVGIALRSRANGQGVDLMRNSPVNCEDESLPFVSGQNFSNKFPWYRGDYNGVMEKEAGALGKVVKKYLWPSRVSMAIDVHSGFGAKDRFWFPYAYSKKPFPLLPEAYAFNELLDQTYPHHIYEIEPVSRQYTIQGDLWDHLFLQHLQREGNDFFLPWTLEMGSWNWLRKNPLQVFSKWGIFHPMKPHRRSRTLRRHLSLFDFIHRSCLSPESWLSLQPDDRKHRENLALEKWYDQ